MVAPAVGHDSPEARRDLADHPGAHEQLVGRPLGSGAGSLLGGQQVAGQPRHAADLRSGRPQPGARSRVVSLACLPPQMRRPLPAVLLTLAVLLVAAPSAWAAQFMVSVMQDDNYLINSTANARNVALNRMKRLGVDAVRV